VTDVLIRDVPDDVLAALEAKAKRAGLSRTEFLRRALARESASEGAAVSVADLERFASSFDDLMNETVMDDAWR
jgi:hypothetical protein